LETGEEQSARPSPQRSPLHALPPYAKRRQRGGVLHPLNFFVALAAETLAKDDDFSERTDCVVLNCSGKYAADTTRARKTAGRHRG